MAVFTGVAEPVAWGGVPCGDIVPFGDGWRATKGEDRARGLTPAAWLQASRFFGDHQDAVDWLVRDARRADKHR